MHLTPPPPPPTSIPIQPPPLPSLTKSENINIARSIDPICEFGQNDLLLLRCFPLLFFLGKGIPCKGSLPKRLVAHLLLYYDQRFAKNKNFGFLLTNQKYRHMVTKFIFLY
jgi:hypothetical protein